MHEAGIAATRRSIDAAIRAGRGKYAERRHGDEVFRVHIDLGTSLGDDALSRLRIDRGEIVGGKVGHGLAPGRCRFSAMRISSRKCRGHRLSPPPRPIGHFGRNILTWFAAARSASTVST